MSAPKAVRERRAARGLDKDTNQALTPSEFVSYRRSLALGNLIGQGKDGGEPTEKEWLARLNDRRNRLRGIRIETLEDGRKKVVAMGQKIYLPNIIFRMVRNHTPPGMPYNPFEATFRIPQSLTKTDIRSYLLSVYGVETTYIRTDNYLSPIHRRSNGSRTTRSYKTYKRAVVGLVEPFEPPPDIEDMANEHQRTERRKYLETEFGIQASRLFQKLALLRMSRKGDSGWRWRSTGPTSRGHILRAIGETRWRRERELEATEELLGQARAEGRPVDKLNYSNIKELANREKEMFNDRKARLNSRVLR